MPHAAPQNTSRKRGYNETVSSDTLNGHDTQPHGRAFKQARRGTNKGRGGGAGDMNGARHVRAAPGFQLPYGAPPPLSFDPMQPPHGLAANPFFNQMTMPLITGIPTRPRRAACRDFVTKGFCGRKNCHYEHTHAGPAGEELDFLAPLPLLPSNDEYDPNRAGLGLDDLGDQLPLRFDSIFQAAMGGGPAFLPLPQSGPPKERNRKGRSPFSADRPVLDKSQSTVVVENIPDQYFSKSDVLAFFSQFGDIENITMQPYRRLAIVKFDSWSAANAAYRSPKVMFENRFVKVFWYKADGSNVPAAPGPLGGAVRDLLATNGHAADADGYPDAEAEVEIDMEEFTRKQEEAQKLFEERRSKTEALERQRETLERRHKELLSKQQAEKQRLRARLASAGAAKDSDRSPSPEITMGGNVTRPSPSKATSDALRTLAALEEEAKQLGLDPDAADDDAASFWTPRGRGRGRGGYFPRARGYAPRGYRGGQRGRGGLAAAFAAYSLDNRPKKVVVSGVDFTSPEKGDALRQFLLVSVTYSLRCPFLPLRVWLTEAPGRRRLRRHGNDHLGDAHHLRRPAHGREVLLQRRGRQGHSRHRGPAGTCLGNGTRVRDGQGLGQRRAAQNGGRQDQGRR